MSIRSKHAEAIMSGRKTIELRRVPPRAPEPIPIVVYSSGERRAMVGTVMLAGTTSLAPSSLWQIHGENARVSHSEFTRYFEGRSVGHALHLTGVSPAEVEIPLEQARQMKAAPPQSWRYIDAALYSRLVGLMHGHRVSGMDLGLSQRRVQSASRCRTEGHAHDRRVTRAHIRQARLVAWHQGCNIGL